MIMQKRFTQLTTFSALSFKNVDMLTLDEGFLLKYADHCKNTYVKKNPMIM